MKMDAEGGAVILFLFFVLTKPCTPAQDCSYYYSNYEAKATAFTSTHSYSMFMFKYTQDT